MQCEKCGVELAVGDWPFCPHGRRGNFTNIPDEFPGGWVELENHGREKVRFHTKSERLAYLKAHGLEQVEKHCPFPGTDRDPQGVQDFRKYRDAQTLENARILLLRAAGVKQEEVEADPMFVRPFSVVGDQKAAVAVATGEEPTRVSRLGRRIQEAQHASHRETTDAVDARGDAPAREGHPQSDRSGN